MERIVFGHFLLYANQLRKIFDQENFLCWQVYRVFPSYYLKKFTVDQ